MTTDRRSIIQMAAALALSAGSATPRMARAADASGTGKPGDFDFLTGEWTIANRFLEKGRWIEFPGAATVVAILGGIASIEELRIPARGFSGMGLRLLDVDKRLWSDHWVNAKSGVISVPGQIGEFKDGVGTFVSEDVVDDVKEIYRGVWDRITPRSCRWFQGMSRDGGKNWTESWFMDWTRV